MKFANQVYLLYNHFIIPKQFEENSINEKIISEEEKNENNNLNYLDDEEEETHHENNKVHEAKIKNLEVIDLNSKETEDTTKKVVDEIHQKLMKKFENEDNSVKVLKVFDPSESVKK